MYSTPPKCITGQKPVVVSRSFGKGCLHNMDIVINYREGVCVCALNYHAFSVAKTISPLIEDVKFDLPPLIL